MVNVSIRVGTYMTNLEIILSFESSVLYLVTMSHVTLIHTAFVFEHGFDLVCPKIASLHQK